MDINIYKKAHKIMSEIDKLNIICTNINYILKGEDVQILVQSLNPDGLMNKCEKREIIIDGINARSLLNNAKRECLAKIDKLNEEFKEIQ